MVARADSESAAALRGALVELARAEPSAERVAAVWTDPASRATLLAAAEAHGLSSTLHDRLVGLDAVVPDALAERRRGATARRLAARSTLARIAPVLDDRGVPWVVCKGPVVAARHDRPEDREFNDLDLLVPGGRLGEVVEALGHAGVESVNRNWGAYLAHGVGEIPLSHGTVWIDLHWDLVGLARTRRHFRLRTAELLGRRRSLPLDGRSVPVLCPVDEVLHLALHAGLGGGGRLCWLRDLRVVVATTPPDWDELVVAARRARLATIVGPVLDRARLVIGADVPADVAPHLVPAPLLHARRWLDDRPTSAGVLGRRVGSAALVRSGRDDLLPTVEAAGREVRTRALAALGRPARWDVADEHSVLYWATEAGGDTAYDRYLELAATA
ncbi:MAG: nucleotidyltransferase family protein [Actinomycetota bacterium]